MTDTSTKIKEICGEKILQAQKDITENIDQIKYVLQSVSQDILDQVGTLINENTFELQRQHMIKLNDERADLDKRAFEIKAKEQELERRENFVLENKKMLADLATRTLPNGKDIKEYKFDFDGCLLTFTLFDLKRFPHNTFLEAVNNPDFPVLDDGVYFIGGNATYAKNIENYIKFGDALLDDKMDLLDMLDVFVYLHLAVPYDIYMKATEGHDLRQILEYEKLHSEALKNVKSDIPTESTEQEQPKKKKRVVKKIIKKIVKKKNATPDTPSSVNESEVPSSNLLSTPSALSPQVASDDTKDQSYKDSIQVVNVNSATSSTDVPQSTENQDICTNINTNEHSNSDSQIMASENNEKIEENQLLINTNNSLQVNTINDSTSIHTPKIFTPSLTNKIPRTSALVPIDAFDPSIPAPNIIPPNIGSIQEDEEQIDESNDMKQNDTIIEQIDNENEISKEQVDGMNKIANEQSTEAVNEQSNEAVDTQSNEAIDTQSNEQMNDTNTQNTPEKDLLEDIFDGDDMLESLPPIADICSYLDENTIDQPDQLVSQNNDVSITNTESSETKPTPDTTKQFKLPKSPLPNHSSQFLQANTSVTLNPTWKCICGASNNTRKCAECGARCPIPEYRNMFTK